MLELKFISDPGHGWLEAHKMLLAELGIQDKISGYSYEHKGWCYLEEDCDAPILIKALEAKGIVHEVFEIYEENTKIRGMKRYAA